MPRSSSPWRARGQQGPIPDPPSEAEVRGDEQHRPCPGMPVPRAVGWQDRAREAFAGLALTSSDNGGDRASAAEGAGRWVVCPGFWQSCAHEPPVPPWGSEPAAW